MGGINFEQLALLAAYFSAKFVNAAKRYGLLLALIMLYVGMLSVLISIFSEFFDDVVVDSLPNFVKKGWAAFMPQNLLPSLILLITLRVFLSLFFIKLRVAVYAFRRGE
jgi:hypothetical protein